MSNDLQVIADDIYDPRTREDFAKRLVDPSISFEAEAGFAVQIIGSNDYMLKAAMSNRTAVLNAVVNVAAIGLSLNPAKKQAYLVPRRPKAGMPVQVCLDISYIGLVELAVASGAIQLAQARVVREKDDFTDNGVGERPTHRYNAFSRDRGEVVGVFVSAKLASGDWHTEIMTVDEINRIRDRSEAFKSGKSNPWVTDWEEMAKKTVAKRASKWWRGKTDDGRLEQAIHYLNTDAGEGLAASDTPQNGDLLDYWTTKAKAAKSEQALNRVYGDAMAAFVQEKDEYGAREFKKRALAEREKLRQANVTDVQPN